MPLRRAFGGVGLLLVPNLLWLMLFMIGPLLMLLAISFRGYQAGTGILDTWEIGQYLKFITDPFYLGILLRTVLMGLGVTALCALALFSYGGFIGQVLC